MKIKLNLAVVVFALSSYTILNAQIKLHDKAQGTLQSGVSSFTFTNQDAAALPQKAVRKMDFTNTVASKKDGYSVRLNRIFGKHKSEIGLNLNYKVYPTKDVTAFATADGSVRVYSGMMDIIKNNQLLAVIGRKIGHVAKEDTKDAIKAAYQKTAIVGAGSSQFNKFAKVTDSQLGQIGNAILDSKFSRKQLTEADAFSYNFLNKNGYNVNEEESAFAILAKLKDGSHSNFFTSMLRSQPDPKMRAERAKKRAEADGLYQPYVQKAFCNKVVVAKSPAKNHQQKEKLKRNNIL